jgi:hypothetical protein
MFIRPATLTDISAIMQVVTDVVPAMIAAGNYQWDNTYPNAEVFENDVALKQLWVVEIDGDIARHCSHYYRPRAGVRQCRLGH